MDRSSYAAAEAVGAGVYSKPAALRRGGGGLSPLNFGRQVVQGACAGLLTLLGGLHLAASVDRGDVTLPPVTGFDATSLQAIAENLAAGGLPGVVEIIGAAALFLNAGRGPGRIIGLLGFIAVAVAHANGLTHQYFLTMISDWSGFAGLNGDNPFVR